MPTPLASRTRRRTQGLRLALAALAVALAGCGAFDSGGGGGPPPLAITTPSLPPAGVNYSYTTQLEASGGAGGYVWTVVAGAMPPGLGVAPNGAVTGTPTSLGTYTVSIEVADVDAATDTASYSLSVTPFQIAVSPLHWGEGWTGESCAVTSVAGAGVTFAFTQNMTGASLSNANPSAGTATYHAGPVPGTDRIRGTSGIGEISDVDVAVVTSPVGNMIARFSTTDVWHVRFDGKSDATHAFASDFDAGLATVGLRGATSYDAQGTTADQLARACVQKATLSYSNLSYLNNADGSPAAGGLKISFPFYEPPTPPYFSPADGDIDVPAPNHFNVITVHYGSISGVIGTAYMDDTANSSQENDTTSPTSGGPLGIFVNEVVPYFNASYANDTLPGAPVSSADVPALKAILYGTGNPGGRYDEIRRIVDGFGRTLAEVVSHEIGHSLGLSHTTPAQSGSIMNASAMIGPGATYQFIAADVAILQADLPGPGRGGAPLYGPVGPGFVSSLLYTGRPGDTVVVCGPCELHRRGGSGGGFEPAK